MRAFASRASAKNSGVAKVPIAEAVKCLTRAMAETNALKPNMMPNARISGRYQSRVKTVALTSWTSPDKQKNINTTESIAVAIASVRITTRPDRPDTG
jgi:hypothetical protein